MTTTLIKIGGADYPAADYTTPVDRTFRDAWDVNVDTSVIHVDMSLAKDLWRDKIRLHRSDALQDLDALYMRALETGSDTTQIVADKQALRDAPSLPSIDAATSADELKSIQPIPGVTLE